MRRYKRLQEDGWGPAVNIAKHMFAVSRRVIQGKGPFTVTQDGEALGFPGGRFETLVKYEKAISNREIGSVFRIRQDNGEVVVAGRAVKVLAVTDSTSGNTNCDRYSNWVHAKFKSFNPRYAGAYVCKPDSQHRYGNAIDFFFDTLAQQEKVANETVANASELNAYHVIDRARIWTKGEGWRAYGGTYHSHIHVDFDPQYYGDCGVRGK